jgi:hypothetical protein
MLMTSDLENRGWTKALIRKFLPTPDKTTANPVFPSKARMRLYALDRVQQIESKEEFQREKAKVPQHRQTAKKAVATKRKRTQEYIDNLVVELPPLSLDELIKLAIEHYNSRPPLNRERAEFWRPAGSNSDVGFLHRIAVNYLRHCCTGYHTHLERIAGKTGVDEAYPKLKKKILTAIRLKYPILVKACENQSDATDEKARLAKQ